MTSAKPNPGSSEAVAAGCKCPVMDNSYGKGYFCQPGIFVLSKNCPIHWPLKKEEPNNDNSN